MLSVGFIASASEIQPVASWNFDKIEGDRIFPSAGKYTALVSCGKYVGSVPGKRGKAVRIQGKYKGNQAGGISVKNFKFDFASPFTVEILVRFDRGVDRKQRREIFSMTDSESGPGIRFSLYYSQLELSTGNGKKKVLIRTASSNLNITLDQWHLLTVTYDGKKAVIYYDGVEAAGKEMEITPSKKNKTLSVGSYKNGLAYPLTGELDELGIYDFCKTAALVAERYTAIFGE